MKREGKPGSVTKFRDKFRAEVNGQYLGLFLTEQDGYDEIDAWLDLQGDRAPDTLAVFGNKFLLEREGRVRDYVNERSRWRNHVATASFADWSMKRIKPRDVDAWVRALLKKKATQVTRKGKSGSTREATDRALDRGTVVHCLRLLSLCCDAAVLAGKIPSNPCLAVKVPRVDEVIEDDEAWAYLSPDEIARLFALKKLPEKQRAVFAVAIYSGLRKGEVLGLRWTDITLDGPRPELRVRRSYAGPTKTKSSRRTVPLLEPLRVALERWKRSGGIVRATGLVFPNRKGGVFGESYDAGWEKTWREAAKIRPHVRFHDLRHTCASHLIMGTWTPAALEPHEVMQWMGHADLKTTQRYVHLAPGWLHSKTQTRPNNKHIREEDQ